MIFSKLQFSENSSRRRTLSGWGEQYWGQGCVVVAFRGWPKPQSSGLNQEPSKKKTSQFDTWFGKFPSSWFDQNFRHEVPGSARKFLVQPGISCLFQELFCFLPESFVVIGKFSTKRKEPWSKNAVSCLKTLFYRVISPWSRIMFHTCRSYPTNHPQPI